MAFFIACFPVHFTPDFSCNLTCNLKVFPFYPKLTHKGYTAAGNRVSINT